MHYGKVGFVDMGNLSISIKDRVYEVKFSVYNPTDRPFDYGSFRVSHIVRCAFYSKIGLCEGYAYCSTKDRYSQLKGMKLSLARALHCSGIKRKKRKKIWKAFLEWYCRYFKVMPFSA